MGNPVKENPLRTRGDVERAAVQLVEPLLPLLSQGKAALHLGETGAVYPSAVADMEGFARVLWAIVPMLSGGCEGVAPLWEAWRQGLCHGVDPSHPEYWGEAQDYDQRLVEMAVMGMGLCLAPQAFYHDLPESAKGNLYRWLDQINHHDMPKNNWTFFRVLVNMGFSQVGLSYPKERMEQDLAMIEEHYEGDGWYFDYMNQRDYYTQWAFHYYGLIYAHVMKEKDPMRSREFVQRGKQMAADFACWFDSTGEALPYGRSLTYRFAQSAFYAALALAEGTSDAVDYGVMKGLLLGNMRKWFRQPIFTRDGVLTIGYHYPNLHMAEGYNAPGSPYWAMKVFLCLALPEEHPFWQAEEKQVMPPRTQLQPHARMLFTRSGDNRHVMAFAAGNHAHEHSHDEAKYEKLVYSTVFGFSVPKAHKLLKDGALDSMLALSEDGDTWHPRYGCESYELTEDFVRSVWKPFSGVRVETKVIPLGQWHVRIHRIESDRRLYAAEGGYAIAQDGAGAIQKQADSAQAVVIAPWGISGVKALRGFEAGEIILPEPNTNLMASRTFLPTLRATLNPGETVLVSAVFGSPGEETDAWENLPIEVMEYATMD